MSPTASDPISRSARPGRWLSSLLAGLLLGLMRPGATTAADWERVYSGDALAVDARPHPGSDIKEVRAQGMIPVPPHIVRAVISDVGRYPEFMPYVKEARILGRSRQGTITYQRVSFGLMGALGVADRDYVLRNVERISEAANGTLVFKRIWNAVAGNGPPPQPSVVRLTVTRGFWQLTPAGASGAQTQVVYCLFTNPGRSLPAWAVNQGNTIGVPKVFKGVRTASQDVHYASTPKPDPALLLANPPDLTGMDESMCAER